MAANNEFPRGLTQESEANGSGTASVTFQAIAGVSWRLKSILADLIQDLNAGTATLGIVTASNSQVQGVLIVPTTYAHDTWQWSGDIIYPSGTGVIVAFNAAAVAGIIQQLNVYAEPS